MTAQPSPRETSIELIADHPVRQSRSKAATQTTAKKATTKATSKTASKVTSKTASKAASKTVAKTATTRQRSATKSVPIAESSLQTTVQAVSPNGTVSPDSCLADLQNCRQFFLSNILAESQKLTQSMEELTSIALRIQQLQRPSFEPIPLTTLRVCHKPPAMAPVQAVAQPPSKAVFVSALDPIVESIAESIAEPTAKPITEPQRPSRTSVSRLTVRKPIPPYDPSGHRSIEPSLSSPAVAPNYWGGNVQAPAAASPVAKASQMRRDRLDLPVFPDRPAQPVLHRLAQQQPHLTLTVQPTRSPADFSIQTQAQPHPFTKLAIYQQIQRLVPIPTEPKAIVVDAMLWTFSSVGVHVILQVCIQTVPLLSFPLHLVMLFPALFAAYLAFCVPQSSTPPVYRCLLTTLGFFFGSKL